MYDSLAVSSPQTCEFLVGGGVMGELIRSKDWSATPLGPIEHWPQSLRSAISLCLASHLPISLSWGPKHIQLYNDGYSRFCGGKHPTCLGGNFTKTFAASWDVLGVIFDRALTGQPAFLENQRIFLDRNGSLEEAFLTFSFSPIRAASNEFSGLFHSVVETTPQMLCQRRTSSLQELALRTSPPETVEEVCRTSAQVLAQNQWDLPFVLIYLVGKDGRGARLVANTLLSSALASPEVVEFAEPAMGPWPLAEVNRTGIPAIVTDLHERTGRLYCGPYPEDPERAVVVPVRIAGMQRPAAFLVAGVSSRLPFNEEYQAFIESAAAAMTVAIGNARRLQAERVRHDLPLEQKLQRSAEAFRRDAAKHKLALESGKLGEWEVDLATGQVIRSSRHAEIFGLPDPALPWSFETFLKQVHPEDRALAEQNFHAVKTGGRLETECRVTRPSGEIRWIVARGEMFRNSEGKPISLLGSVEDITERKQIAETLRASEEKMRMLLDGVKDYAVYMLDPEGRIVTWNEGAVRIKGYSSDEIFGKSIALFYTAADRAMGYPELAFREAVTTGRFEQQGMRVRKDGSTFWAHVVILPLYGEDGKLRGFSKVLQDISEQKRSQDALRESEARMQTLADSIPQLVFMAQADGNVLWYNQRWYEYTGKTFDEMQGWGWQSAHDPTVLPEVMKNWTHAIETGEHFEMVFPLRAADGVFHPFLTRVVPLRDQDGKIARWFGTNTDITSQRRIEDALRANEERLRMAQEVAEIATFEWNLQTGEKWQTAASATFRLPNGEVSSAEEFKLGSLHPDDRQRAQRQIANALQTGGFESELRAIRSNGTERWLFVRARVINDDAGKPLRMIGAVVDITDRKSAELEILRMNADLEQRVHDRTLELEAANKELAAFSYSVSHDLRAPLRGIDGWSMALLEDYGAVLDARGQEYLSRVRSETQQIGKLIDDMLRLSRVTRDEMIIEPVDMTALAGSIADKLREAEPQRSIEFIFEPGLVASGDHRLMEIALTNLLSNAVKFASKRDKALIEFGKLEERGENTFYVRDNGAGFNMAYVDNLFGAFQRLHKFSEFPGTGIGLAIVQRVIARHGGRVWADAKVNEGATFWFTLGAQS